MPDPSESNPAKDTCTERTTPAVSPSVVKLVEKAAYSTGFSSTPKRGYHTLPCGLVERDPPCCVNAVTVGCGHAARGFILKPPTTKTDKNWQQVIQVLAQRGGASSNGSIGASGEQAFYDEVKIDLYAGSCTQGFASKPAVMINGERIQASKSLRFQGPSQPTAIPLYTFLERCLSNDPKMNAISYGASIDCCSGAEEYGFVIQVFPYKKWSGSITLGYELGMETQTVDQTEIRDEAVYHQGRYIGDRQVVTPRKSTVYTLKDRGVFKASIALEATFGAQTTRISSPTYERAGTPSSTPYVPFAKMKAFFEKWLPRLHSLCSNDLVTIVPVWPNVTLGGELATAERKGAYDVVWNGKFSFAAKPLIGIQGTSDILSWLIMCGTIFGIPPAMCLRLVTLKKKAERGFGNKKVGGKVVCKIEMTGRGQVSGSLDWTYNSEAKDMVQGSLSADLDFTVVGEVSAEVRALLVSYIAGASITGTSGLSGKITGTFYGDAPALNAGLSFKGLSIEAVTYMSVGRSSVGAPPKGAAKSAMRKAQAEGRLDYDTMRTSETESAWKIVLLEPAILWEPKTAFNQPGKI